MLEGECIGKERNVNNRRCKQQSENHRSPDIFVLAAETENRSSSGTHVEGVENFHHGQCQEGHCHTIRAVDDLPSSGLDIMSDEI